MDADSVRARVRSLIGQLAPTPRAAPASSARLVEDLAYNSLAMMDLAVALEKEFKLDPISEDDASAIANVGHVEDLVVSLLETAGRL